MRLEEISVAAYEVPTETPEADGTLDWESTTIVVVEARSGKTWGLGYTYAAVAAAQLVQSTLAPRVLGEDALGLKAAWQRMHRAVRNQGWTGLASMAMAAVDNALWDLKARLLDVPLVRLWDAAREQVPVYGSGGFTNYSSVQLQGQLAAWAEQGLRAVKMKIGRQPDRDPGRVALARQAIGEGVDLMVDANGSLTRNAAQQLALELAAYQVSWFEEPLPASQREEMRSLRRRLPAGMQLALGEYAWQDQDFLDLLQSRALDVLQADATRCGGASGFLRADALAQAFGVPLSAHCAPQLHAHLGCACPSLVHLEYFHDHVRIEELFFEGTLRPDNGCLQPGDAPGWGLTLKRADVERYQIFGGSHGLA